MARASSRVILACVALAVFAASVVGVLSLTSTNRNPKSCPKCGTPYVPGDIVRRPSETYFMCRKCLHNYTRPASYDFSWGASAEHYIEGGDPMPSAVQH